MENLHNVIQALNARGFIASYAKDGEEAAEQALALIGNSSVGFGGSVTVQKLGLYEALQKRGNAVYWHWCSGAEQKLKAATADFYVCSANALTKDGIPVLTDGTGNRVSALSNGPGNAVLIVGKNKIVENLSAAFDRIKSGECSGQNALRLGLELPCGQTGKCTDCRSPQRMCSVTAFWERPSKGLKHTYVIVVDEDMGY